jgi:hypothetical protein
VETDDLSVAHSTVGILSCYCTGKRYGDKAAMEAVIRSNSTLEIGDTFNYKLWQRVCMAVQELVRSSPKGGEVVN